MNIFQAHSRIIELVLILSVTMDNPLDFDFIKIERESPTSIIKNHDHTSAVTT